MGCTWKSVILDQNIKEELTKDFTGFFDRKEYYRSFGVPRKRGLILHGLHGNGKTISIKAVARSLNERTKPIPTLYVKSLGLQSTHDDIRSIFEKARETAPCLLVFEDLNSLVTDDVRSFFLNDIDGLEDNDGILMVGSTNYLDKLDAGIPKRSSPFDRKYHFPLPAKSERARYCDFWRTKLWKNASLDFSPDLTSKVTYATEGFAFAYLQEVFVSAMTSIITGQKASSLVSADMIWSGLSS